MDIFVFLGTEPKEYPLQQGLLFHKSMPFRAEFLNFSDAPHSLQMRIDYSADSHRQDIGSWVFPPITTQV
jgi:hypothetical protein